MSSERHQDGERGTTDLEPGQNGDPYEEIKDAIYLGDLSPGQHLIETTLAQLFKVSRTPIREALTRLEQDGMLVRERGGLKVRERAPGEVLDIYDIRIQLEGAVAAVAAERRTTNDLLLLKKAHRRYLSTDPEDPKAMVTANRSFHQAVWQAAHHLSLSDLLQRIDLHLSRFPLTTISYPGRWPETCDEHAEILDAIEDRDSDQARATCQAHFTRAREIRLKLWENEA